LRESCDIRGKKHYVYSDIKEFEYYNKGVEVKDNWRTSDEGDWVYSDDGKIIQLLKVSKSVNHPGDRKNYKYANGWVRTAVGSFINRENTKMDAEFSLHKNRYTFSKKIKDTNKRIKEREKVTKKEKEFATNIVVGMGAVDAYKNTFKEDSDNKARKKAAVLLKQERVMKEIEKSVLDVAKSLGIDHQYILGKLKTLADFSEDDNIVLSSTKELGKAIGTVGNFTKQKEVGLLGMFKGFTTEELTGAARENPQLEEKNEVVSEST
tara:strand:+ start:344 stop:1138 length:795 start_codon:yes stop_codon:yes gene_type:complete